MPMLSLPAALAIGAAVSAVGTAATVAMSAKGAADQKQAEKRRIAAAKEEQRIKQKRADLDTARSRMVQLRKGREERARMINMAENANVGSASSGLLGGLSNISTTMGREQGYTNLQTDFSSQLSFLSSEQARYANKFDKIGRNTRNLQSIFQGASSIGGSMVAYGGGYEQLGKNVQGWWNG
jgi:hypothetical protein